MQESKQEVKEVVKNGRQSTGPLNILRTFVSVNVQDDEEHRPIHFCCKSGHLVVLHYLLEQGADPHVANIYGDTPLHL